jgi:hypothetical protein
MDLLIWISRSSRPSHGAPPPLSFCPNLDNQIPMVLNLVSKDTKAKVLLMRWAWHLWNNIVHGKGLATVSRSAEFLTSYAKSLNIVEQTVAGGRATKAREKYMKEAWHAIICKRMTLVHSLHRDGVQNWRVGSSSTLMQGSDIIPGRPAQGSSLEIVMGKFSSQPGGRFTTSRRWKMLRPRHAYSGSI